MNFQISFHDLLILIPSLFGALGAWQNMRIQKGQRETDLKILRLELKLTGRISNTEKELAVLEASTRAPLANGAFRSGEKTA